MAPLTKTRPASACVEPANDPAASPHADTRLACMNEIIIDDKAIDWLPAT
jgi:hypothetical protein